MSSIAHFGRLQVQLEASPSRQVESSSLPQSINQARAVSTPLSTSLAHILRMPNSIHLNCLSCLSFNNRRTVIRKPTRLRPFYFMSTFYRVRPLLTVGPSFLDKHFCVLPIFVEQVGMFYSQLSPKDNYFSGIYLSAVATL
ncbi:unnamed protein product [Protopolystoma xenopodis]|uniref:Uncharacterized protein n=1 Tax=Protopolystoma xenopodis TaxID=117903 RepID=A0A448XRJ5_9PLAT|nr:unnamed protein product [Protopolystoma xenopodis]